jgi:hypothetical protein
VIHIVTQRLSCSTVTGAIEVVKVRTHAAWVLKFGHGTLILCPTWLNHRKLRVSFVECYSVWRGHDWEGLAMAPAPDQE